MRKLSYFILGIILLLVIIFAVTPIFVGSSMQSYVKNMASTLQQKYPGSSVEVTQYDRHWFSSDARFKLTYHMPYFLSGLGRNKPITLTFDAHIKHGPVVSFSRDGKRYHELGKSVVILTSPEMQGNITLVSNWQHNLTVLFDVDSFTHQSKDLDITLKNLDGYLNYSHASQSIQYDVSIGSFDHTFNFLAKIKDQYTSTNSKLTGTLTRENNFWAGNVMMTRDRVSLTRNGTPMLTLKDTQTNYRSQVNGQRANILIDIKSGDTTFAGEKYGAMAYSFTLTNVDIPALNQLIAAAQKLYLNSNFSFSMVVSIYSPIFELIEKGMTLNVQNFTLNLPNSNPIKLTASVQFVEAPQDLNFANLFKYMSASGQLTLPREFLMQQLTEFYQDVMDKNNETSHSATARASSTIDQWVARKMLVNASKNSYEINFSVKDGTLLINGQPPHFELEKSSPETH